MDRFHLPLFLMFFWVNILYSMEQVDSKKSDSLFDTSEGQSASLDLSTSSKLREEQKSIQKLKNSFQVAHSSEEQYNILASSLIHYLTIAEELQKTKHSQFINVIFSIRALKQHLDATEGSYINRYNANRIKALEQFFEESYTPSFNTKLPPEISSHKLIDYWDKRSQSLKKWQHHQKEIITLTHNIHQHEKQALEYWRLNKTIEAREHFTLAIDNLIEQARLELNLEHPSQSIARLLFKARILLTHFDEKSARKKVFLGFIKNINNNLEQELEPIIIQEPLSSHNTSNAFLGESSS